MGSKIRNFVLQKKGIFSPFLLFLLILASCTNQVQERNDMQIKIYPDPILSQRCEAVSPLDGNVNDILDQMAEKLYEWEGVGLAAPQVGILKRMVVIDVREEPGVLYKMINPYITWRSEEIIDSEEGCLSLPKVGSVVKRNEKVVVEYLDENFKQHKLEADGLLARCIQHELDHLDGKMYIDRLSSSDREDVIMRFYEIMDAEKEQKDQVEP